MPALIFGFSRLLLYSFFIIPVNKLCSTEIDECQRVDPECESYLGTKTPYRAVVNQHKKIIKFKGCEPVRIIGIVRHGTRTPGKKFKDKVKRLASLKDIMFEKTNNQSRAVRLCNEDLEHLKNWKWRSEGQGDKWLTHEGEDEMVELAERLQNLFPSLLLKHYSNDTFFFRSTATQRAVESARHFTIGLFGRKESRYVWFPEPVHKDPILRFYKLCDRWREEVKKNSSTYTDLEKFKYHDDVSVARERISKILGFTFTLSYDDIHLMYVTCSFETAWYKNYTSPWCSIFSRNDLQVFEYAEDLKYYWRDGYGFQLNHKQACPVIKDIFSRFKGAKQPNVFYFTHSGTLLKILSHLGLYKDPFVLKYDTPKNEKTNREWRVSYIDTFGTNIIFVSFNCGGINKILTLHQERVVRIPGCPSDLCPLSVLEDVFKNSLEECDFDNMCAILYDETV